MELSKNEPPNPQYPVLLRTLTDPDITTSLFMVDSLISLLTLTLLEIVLGIDNVIFVSILIGRLEPSRQLDGRRIRSIGNWKEQRKTGRPEPVAAGLLSEPS